MTPFKIEEDDFCVNLETTIAGQELKRRVDLAHFHDSWIDARRFAGISREEFSTLVETDTLAYFEIFAHFVRKYFGVTTTGAERQCQKIVSSLLKQFSESKKKELDETPPGLPPSTELPL